MIRQTIEAVEPLDVLTPQQRDLVVELDDVELAAYRVVTDLDGDRETSLIVAPRDPRLQPGTDVAAERDSSVLWSENAGRGIGADSAAILVSSRLVPFDWDAYWAAAPG